VALIERVFGQGLKGSANGLPGSRAWQLIPFYSGGGGGVGVTTIMGTLARYLSSQGDRILLVDGAPHSTLGFFFNGVASPEGVSSFAPESPAGNEAGHLGRVDISCRPAALCDRPRGEDTDSWALQSIVQLGAEADRVFVDIGSEGSGRAQLCLLAAGNPLVVITPDVRCVPGVTRLMRLLTTQEQALERFITPSFLLNRFDPGVPFHIETLNRLAELLGDRLLTIYIPRLGEISEIAAEGMTVVDFNPASAAAESFYHLAEWIRTSRRANLSTVLGRAAKAIR
jgi:cellulose biosynthesis protein BcsQ